MSKIKECPECGASVGRANLERHRKKVHGRGGGELESCRKEKANLKREEANQRSRGARRRRGALLLSSLAIGGLLMIGLVWFASSAGWIVRQPPPDVKSTCVEHTGLGIHWHAVLTITISGAPQTIPANIGIRPGCMSPLHTHAEDGVIHIEYSRPVSFELGQFFELWEQPFDEDTLLWHEGPVKVTVDGKSSALYGKQALANGMRIDLVA